MGLAIASMFSDSRVSNRKGPHRARALLAATVLAVGASFAQGAGHAFAQGVTTFSYTGASQTYTVPSGICSLIVDARGAAGGDASALGAFGGLGGEATATISVTPGEILQINVGGQGLSGSGTTGGAGGFNGGASGGGAGNAGAGGGGASDVRNGAFTLADRLVVAGEAAAQAVP